MKDGHNQDIEELMNAYLDGEASQRQQTELKRMMLHDPSMNERIKSLEAQKRLLNALPVETAPAGLADEVRAALERRLILENFAAPQHNASVGRARRSLTAAAMLLLPLGLLGVLVYQIMKPPSETAPYIPTDRVIADGQADPASAENQLAGELPFDGVLTFQTHQYMSVCAFVEKMIFDQGLLEVTMPARTADASSYQLKTSPEKVIALVDALQDTWGRSTTVALTVPVNTDAGSIDIPNVKIEQVKTLAVENSSSMFSRLAARYASANKNSETFYAKEDPENQLGPNGFPPLNQPIMTGRYTPAPAGQSDTAIQLKIVIQRPQQ